MKTIVIVSVALLSVLWAVMLFVIKTGDVAYILLAAAGIIMLLGYSMRRGLS